MPVTIQNHELDFDYQGALLYEMTPEKGIVLKSKLPDEASKDKEYYEQGEDQIQRLIYIDDLVYAVSNLSITSYSLEDFKKTDSVDLN
ncbi:beta-propeller domain-containing protein [Bacillus sp. NTK074B]|uniref:beta-propeller domain-containing protein n=1 Tax=Bacillus sp. NTK074B TaxID=2802174 RepID=UPI001A8C4F82|nr:beta-propeller domain-containing protein [Bacillus sp. NTK074B]